MLCFLKYWKRSVQVTLKGIYLKSHTKGLHPQTPELSMATYDKEYLVPCESTADEVSTEWSQQALQDCMNRASKVLKKSL